MMDKNSPMNESFKEHQRAMREYVFDLSLISSYQPKTGYSSKEIILISP